MDGSPGALLPLPEPATTRLTPRERDYLLLSILVRVQHLRFDEAQVLADALAQLSADDPDAEFARAVIAYRRGDYEAVRECLTRLDRIDPADATATARNEDRARIRSFMKARASFALTGALDDEARASLDYYLRRTPRHAGAASEH
ncbi:hypothetical protein [Marivita sp. GX14005]|uniref:hypothetical protein n=1 Tax=Marivita sp. GX14005 TaxID=2942276 RepID=UPI002019180A|nr:hypothetical protein [Marivita sp. GX14005]MCL3883327.1 hypothetical protein [Marivita sp. GX14005]